MTGAGRSRMISCMRLPSALAWLVDAASTVPGADHFLATLGAQLIADGLPLAGGALTLSAPHPIIARRTWLWRAETGAVIEALGFGSLGPAGPEQGNVGRDWLVGLGTGVVLEDVAGSAPDGPTSDSPASNSPVLGWALSRPLTEAESALLHQAARFAAAPLAVLATRSTLAALLEAYLGRRSAAQVLAGRLRRETGETIRAVLLYGDLRGFTELSEAMAPEAVVAALDAWFDRVAGAVHAFGGEVLKFIGDGVLAIFPIGERPPSAACDAALRAVAAARAGMAHLDQARRRARPAAPPLRHGAASRRHAVGQYRHRRPAGLHRDRPCRQPGQPARRAVQAPRPQRAGLGRGRGGDDNGVDPSGRARIARHRHALRGLHSAGRRRRPGRPSDNVPRRLTAALLNG